MKLFNIFKHRKKSTSTSTSSYSNDSYVENNYKINNIDYKSLPEKSILIADIIMLYNFSKKPCMISEKIYDYPQYFIYRYDVNPIKLSQRLANEKFLYKGLNNDSMVNFLNGLKTSILKDLLKKKDIKCTGKKELLVNCILTNYTVEELSKLYPEANNFYYISKKGLSYINENSDLIKLHKHYSQYMIEYEEYMVSKQNNPSLDFYEICIDVFKKRETQYINEKEMWGLLRNTYFNLYNAYKQINDNNNACKSLVKAIYIDLSGMNNNNLVINLRKSNLCLSKFLIKEKECYKVAYLEDCLDIPLPFTFFETNTLKIIFDDILNDCADIEKYKITYKPKTNLKDYTYFKP